MFKRLIILSLVICTYSQGFTQIPGLTFTAKKDLPDLYLKTKTIWVTETPFFFVERKFSPDQGSSYIKVGMFGGNVKPYIAGDSATLHDLNNYKLTRIFGIAQMGVIAPLLAYKHFYPGSNNSTGNQTLDENIQQEEQTGYLAAAIIIFGTGMLTYHVFSKGFLFDALERYNYVINGNADFEDVSFNMTLKLDQISQTPQLKMVWTF
ncbi:MAG: hypothetical protein C0597_08790 [Marinilabiliales bacterium]|nr:MAG: hypothetical protein C0597_08790 [Marinilabiliales bacterium]